MTIICKSWSSFTFLTATSVAWLDVQKFSSVPLTCSWKKPVLISCWHYGSIICYVLFFCHFQTFISANIFFMFPFTQVKASTAHPSIHFVWWFIVLTENLFTAGGTARMSGITSTTTISKWWITSTLIHRWTETLSS